MDSNHPSQKDTQEITHGKLAPADAAIPIKKILHGTSAGELIRDLFDAGRN